MDTELSHVLTEFFTSKQEELLVLSRQAVAHHGGLRGDHREEITKSLLGSILPKWISYERGEVYDTAGHHSKELDIILWDSLNYPNLPMHGHGLFLAESVRAVIQVKSQWNTRSRREILENCASVFHLHPLLGFHSVDTILRLVRHLNLEASPYVSFIPIIPYVAIVLNGGEHFSPNHEPFTHGLEIIEEQWPDIVYFVGSGILVTKTIIPGESQGIINFYQQSNSLFHFTIELLKRLDPLNALGDPSFLEKYGDVLYGNEAPHPTYTCHFPITEQRRQGLIHHILTQPFTAHPRTYHTTQ